jgi:hypothetical protein
MCGRKSLKPSPFTQQRHLVRSSRHLYHDEAAPQFRSQSTELWLLAIQFVEAFRFMNFLRYETMSTLHFLLFSLLLFICQLGSSNDERQIIPCSLARLKQQDLFWSLLMRDAGLHFVRLNLQQMFQPRKVELFTCRLIGLKHYFFNYHMIFQD